LQDRLEQATQAAQREMEGFALLFLDLDGFKAVNDTHGHAVGDGLLCLVAAYLRAAMRVSDTVARLGGDEFVVVCETASPNFEVDIRARIEVGVARAASALAEGAAVTASVGAAWSADDTATPDDLLHRADAAMYEEKRARR
jgi:diguanylate cyclase (GGDEF)-like protein